MRYQYLDSLAPPAESSPQYRHPLVPPHPIHITNSTKEYCDYFFNPHDRNFHPSDNTRETISAKLDTLLKDWHVALLPEQTIAALNLPDEEKQLFKARKTAQEERLTNPGNRTLLKSLLTNQYNEQQKKIVIPVLKKILEDILRCHRDRLLDGFNCEFGRTLWIAVWEKYWRFFSSLITDQIQLIMNELDAKIHLKIDQAGVDFLASPAASHLHAIIPLRNLLVETLRNFSALTPSYFRWNDSRHIFTKLSDIYSIIARTHFYNGDLKTLTDQLSHLINCNIDAFDHLETHVFGMGTAFIEVRDLTQSSPQTVTDDDSEVTETLASASPARGQSFDDLYAAPAITRRSCHLAALQEQNPSSNCFDYVLVQTFDAIEPESKHKKLDTAESRENFIPLFSAWMARIDGYTSLYKKILERCLELSLKEFTQNDSYFSMASRSITGSFASMTFFKPTSLMVDINSVRRKFEEITAQSATLSSVILFAHDMTRSDDVATKAVLYRFIGTLMYLYISEQYIYDFFDNDIVKERIERDLALLSSPTISASETAVFVSQFLASRSQVAIPSIQ